MTDTTEASKSPFGPLTVPLRLQPGGERINHEAVVPSDAVQSKMTTWLAGMALHYPQGACSVCWMGVDGRIYASASSPSAVPRSAAIARGKCYTAKELCADSSTWTTPELVDHSGDPNIVCWAGSAAVAFSFDDRHYLAGYVAVSGYAPKEDQQAARSVADCIIAQLTQS